MLRRVILVRTDVAEERIAFIIRAIRIAELGTTLAVASNRSTLTLMEAIRCSETSVLTGVTQRNISEDSVRHSRRRDNLKSYIALTGWTL
jgi:hypothetical protein